MTWIEVSQLLEDAMQIMLFYADRKSTRYLISNSLPTRDFSTGRNAAAQVLRRSQAASASVCVRVSMPMTSKDTHIEML